MSSLQASAQVKESMDARAEDSCYVPQINDTLFDMFEEEEVVVSMSKATFEPYFPTDLDFLGFGEGQCEASPTLKPFVC